MRMLLPALILGLAGTAAQAADNGFYLGGGVSQAQVDDIFDSDIDLDNTAWKVIAGFRPLDLFAVEANYLDLGSEQTVFGRANAKALSAMGLLYLPIPVPLLGVYAKAGVVRWELDGSVTGNIARFDEDGTEFAWGGGAQLNFGSLSARLEYDNFDIENTDGVNVFSLGLTYTFL